MKKRLKKLTLHRETLVALEDASAVIGGAPVKTVDITACASNCLGCSVTCPRPCGW